MARRSDNPGPRPRGGPPRRILAVIGAGASGTLTAAHVLRASRGAWRVVLIDREGHGTGVAYSTCDPRHLLNVQAGCMSAFDDEPDGFLRWCADRGHNAKATDYLPRRLYGAYLQDLLRRFAAPASLELVRKQAVALSLSGGRRPLVVTLADATTINADAAVLALGNASPAPIGAGTSIPRVIADPWRPSALAPVQGAKRVLVAGMGLTAVDVTLSITAACEATEVIAISRHGRLPQAHLAPVAPSAARSEPTLRFDDTPVTLDLIAGHVGEAIRANPAGWRDVVDSLRPQTTSLWRALSLDERRRFMGELKWLWDLHRHRMAPAVAAEINELREQGRMRLEQGAVTAARATPGGVRVELHTDGGRRVLDADWLVNATGPAGGLPASDDLLVRQLLTDQLACGDELGIGFACDDDGELLGEGHGGNGRIYTLGPPRRGELLESTAIPEIRGQAAAISRALLAHAGDRKRLQAAIAAR
jgi:uncharacterized NAD(P)/FAD-binding protein YdhS